MLERIPDRLMETLYVFELAKPSIMRDQALSGVLGFMRIKVVGISGIGAVGDDAFQVGNQLGALLICDARLLVFKQPVNRVPPHPGMRFH